MALTTRGYLMSEPVWVASGTAAGSSYPTSGVEYVPLVQGAADEIDFQLSSPILKGALAIEVIYAMSVANAGDIDLRLDSLALSVGSDPNAALSTGTPATFVPGNDTNVHAATHANFELTVAEGDSIFCKLVRPATDTHTGDVRVIEIRVLKA